MNQETQDFESLRRLLALKRHEVPPPGYFHRFSSQVIARLRDGERGEQVDFLQRLLWEAPWLRPILAALEAKPILVGACSVAVCALLIGGVIYSDSAEVPPIGLVPVAESGAAPIAPTVMAVADHPLLAKPAPLLETSSTSPIPTVPTEGPLMGDVGQLHAQRAALTFPGGH